MTTLNTTPSLYDTIPNLDSWYECKNEQENEPYRTVPCMKKRRNNSTNGCVSFSSDPPAVYHYEENNKPERPNHRRSSSSEHVKELLKHYTSKLSRQLSHRSNRT